MTKQNGFFNLGDYAWSLFLVFLIFKLLGKFEWNWWVVVSPISVYIAIVMICKVIVSWPSEPTTTDKGK